MAIISSLIEGLPDEVALMCLARVPYYLFPKLELVSHSWKDAIRSFELFRVRNEVGSCEDLFCVCCQEPDNTWQLYDPLQDLWVTLPKLPSKRRYHPLFGAAVSTSQKLFVLGGRCDDVGSSSDDHDDKFASNEVWSYDLVTREWSMRAPMLVPRVMFAACVLDGKIIVAGGYSSRTESTSKAEMYDPEKDLWVPLPDLLQTLAMCTGVVIGGKVHVIYHGLSTVQIFDHLELKWRLEYHGPWLPGPRTVVRDSLYVLSQGFIFKKNGQIRQDLVSASQFHERRGMAMIGLRDKIYVVGGVICRDFTKLSDVHVLTLEGEKPTWSCATPMTRCRGNVLGCTQLRI